MLFHEHKTQRQQHELNNGGCVLVHSDHLDHSAGDEAEQEIRLMEDPPWVGAGSFTVSICNNKSEQLRLSQNDK